MPQGTGFVFGKNYYTLPLLLAFKVSLRFLECHARDEETFFHSFLYKSVFKFCLRYQMREIGKISNRAVEIYQSLGFHGDTSGVPQGTVAQLLRVTYGEDLKLCHKDLMGMAYFRLENAKETKKRCEDDLFQNPLWHSSRGKLDDANITIEGCEIELSNDDGIRPYKDHLNRLRGVAVDYMQKGLEYINREYDNLKLPLNDYSFRADYVFLVEKITEKKKKGNQSKTSVLSLAKVFNCYIKKIDDAIVQNQAKLKKDLESLKKEGQPVSSFHQNKLIETKEKIKVLQKHLKSSESGENNQYFLSELLQEVETEIANRKAKELVNFLEHYKKEGDINFYDEMSNNLFGLQSLAFKTSLDQKMNESEYFRYVKLSEISNKRKQSSLGELYQDIQEMESIKKGYRHKKIQTGLSESHQQIHGEILATMNNVLGVMGEKMKEVGVNPALFLGEELKRRYDMAFQDISRTNLAAKSLPSIAENFFELLKGFDRKYFEIEKVLQTNDLDKKSILQLIEIKEALEKIQQQPSWIEGNKKDQYVVMTENVTNQLMGKLSLKKEELDQNSVADLIKLKNDLKNPKLLPLSNEDEQARNVSLNLLKDAISEKKAILKTLSVKELINLQSQFQGLQNEEQVKEDVLDITTYLKVLIQSIHLRDNEIIQSLRDTPINDLVYFKEVAEALNQKTEALLQEVDRAVNEMQENYNKKTVIDDCLTKFPTYQTDAKKIIAQVAYFEVINKLNERFNLIDESIPKASRDTFGKSKVKFGQSSDYISGVFLKAIHLFEKDVEKYLKKMDKLVRFWELKLLETKHADAFDRLRAAINILPEDKKSALLKLADEMRKFKDCIECLEQNYKEAISPQEQHSNILKYSKELDDLIKEINQETEKEKPGITDRLLKEARESFSALDMAPYGFAQLEKVDAFLNEKIQIVQENIWKSIQKIQAGGEMDIKLAVAEIAAFKKDVNFINGSLEVFKTYDHQLNALVARFEKAMQSIHESSKKQHKSQKFTNLLERVESLILQGYDPSSFITEMGNKTLSLEKTARISELMVLQQNIQASLDQVNALVWLLPDERKAELQSFEKQLCTHSTQIIKLHQEIQTSITADQVNDLGQVISNFEKEVKTFSIFSEFKANTKDEIVATFERRQEELLDEARHARERLEAFKGEIYLSERDQYFDVLNSILEPESLKLLDQDGNLDLSQIAKLHQLRKELTESGAKCKESLIALYRQLEVSDVVEKRHEEIKHCVPSDAFEVLARYKVAMDNKFLQIGVGLQRSVQEDQKITIINVLPHSWSPFDDDVLELNNPFDHDGHSWNPFDDEVELSVDQPVEKDHFELLEAFQAYQQAKDTYETQCHDALKEVYDPQASGLEFMTFLFDAQCNCINKHGKPLLTPEQSGYIKICLDELSALESVPLGELNVNHVYAFQTIQSRLKSFEIEIKEHLAESQTQKVCEGITHTTAYKLLKEKQDRLKGELEKAQKAFIKPSGSWFEKTRGKIKAIQDCLEIIDGDRGFKLDAIKGAVQILKNNPDVTENRGIGLGKVETIGLVEAFVKAVEDEIHKVPDLNGLDTMFPRRERGQIVQTYVNPFKDKLSALQANLLQLPDTIKALPEEQLLEWNTKHLEISNKVEDFNESVEQLVKDGKGNTLLTQYDQLSSEINQFNDELQNAEKALKQAEAERIRAENKEIIKAIKSDYEKLELPDGYEKVEHKEAKLALNKIEKLISELPGFTENREDIQIQQARLEAQLVIFENEKNTIQEALDKINAPIPRKILNVLEEGFEGGKEVVGDIMGDIEQTVKKGGDAFDNFFKEVVEIFTPTNKGLSSNPNIFLSSQNQSKYDFGDLEERMTPAQKKWLNDSLPGLKREISNMIFNKKVTCFKEQAKQALRAFQGDQSVNIEKDPKHIIELKDQLKEACEACRKFIDKAFGSKKILLAEEQKEKIVHEAVTARLEYLLSHEQNWKNMVEFGKAMLDEAFYFKYFFEAYRYEDKSLKDVMETVRGSANDSKNKGTVGEVGKAIRNLPGIHEGADLVDKGWDTAKEIPGIGVFLSGVDFLGGGIAKLIGGIKFNKPGLDIEILGNVYQIGFQKNLAEFFCENRSLQEAQEKYGDYKFSDGQSYRSNFVC